MVPDYCICALLRRVCSVVSRLRLRLRHLVPRKCASSCRWPVLVAVPFDILDQTLGGRGDD